MFILGGLVFYSLEVCAEYIVTADKIKYSDNISDKYLISNNKLYAHNWGSTGTFYIMACK